MGPLLCCCALWLVIVALSIGFVLKVPVVARHSSGDRNSIRSDSSIPNRSVRASIVSFGMLD